MSFVHPSYAAIVIVKWQRSSLMEKKSIVFSIAVTTSVELLLIVMSTVQETFLCYWKR
jgi:hypothetical protein